jgi:hypothetical protein
MDFVFMLTRSDRTIDDWFEVLDDVGSVGVSHIGFKDVGIAPEAAAELVARIRELGAISYMEVVSTSAEACLRSARLAREVAVDRLLGGTQVQEVLAILGSSAIDYYPFPGRPFDHPTRLAGSAVDIAEDCQRFGRLGCAGVDLLAYRAIDADPIALVHAARRATERRVLVAGSVTRPEQVHALAAAGADAFTVGSAVFDGSFASRFGSMRAQLRAVLDACR